MMLDVALCLVEFDVSMEDIYPLEVVLRQFLPFS
jgi:hypothetical protein